MDLLSSLDDAVEEHVNAQLAKAGQDVPIIDIKTIVELVPLAGQKTEDGVLDQLQRIGSPLLRKIRGTRQVIGVTRDDVSQAANSLIEFIDRILRDSFSDAEVLGWVDDHAAIRVSELTYVVADGSRRPTKLGQALCFLHAGCAPPEDDALIEVAARSITAARRDLQKLKHADHDSPDDRAALMEAFEVLEAGLLLTFKAAWRMADQSALETLQGRLSDVA